MLAGLAKLARTITVAFAALGAIIVIVTFTPALQWWAAWLTGDRWEFPKGDRLIVLSAEGDNAGATMGYSSYWRAVHAVNAWREGAGRTSIIISGSGSSSTSIQDYLISHGIPPTAIVIESRSHSTRENALLTAQLLSDSGGPPVLLTSDFHMRRARACFASAGIDVTPVPVPDAMKRYQLLQNRWWVFTDLVMETSKLAGYKLRGWC